MMAKTKQPEPKDFYTIDEVADLLEIDRTSVYPYIKALQIERHKFQLKRNRYISAHDFERIKQFRANPWKAENLHE